MLENYPGSQSKKVEREKQFLPKIEFQLKAKKKKEIIILFIKLPAGGNQRPSTIFSLNLRKF